MKSIQKIIPLIVVLFVGISVNDVFGMQKFIGGIKRLFQRRPAVEATDASGEIVRELKRAREEDVCDEQNPCTQVIRTEIQKTVDNTIADVGCDTRKHQNLRKKSGNEDRYDILFHDTIFGVALFDGHGGDQVSVAAKEILLKDIIARYQANHGDIQHCMKCACIDFDQNIGPKNVDVGATAAIMICANNQLVVGHCGDSRVVICSHDQNDCAKIVYETVDHTGKVQSEIDRVEAAGGFIGYQNRVGGILMVTRALGDYQSDSAGLSVDSSGAFVLGTVKLKGVTAEPECKVLDNVADIDFAIVASDGFWDKISSEDAADYVHKRLQAEENVSVKTIAQDLLKSVYEKREGIYFPGHDDTTVMIVVFKK